MSEQTVSDAELAALQASASLTQVRDITLTPAEVLALNTAPKEVVANPGAGYAVELLSAVFSLNWESVAYATNGDLTIRTKTTNTVLSDTLAAADLLDNVADTVRVMQALSADVSLDDGEALELFCATGDPTAGNSPVRVRVVYRIHPTGL